MPKYKIVVTASWTYEIKAKDADDAFEIIASDLPKCTLENMDDGTFYINEPVQLKSTLLSYFFDLFKKPRKKNGLKDAVKEWRNANRMD